MYTYMYIYRIYIYTVYKYTRKHFYNFFELLLGTFKNTVVGFF